MERPSYNSFESHKKRESSFWSIRLTTAASLAATGSLWWDILCYAGNQYYGIENNQTEYETGASNKKESKKKKHNTIFVMSCF